MRKVKTFGEFINESHNELLEGKLKVGDFVSDINDEEGRVGKISNISGGTADIDWNNEDDGESLPIKDLVKTKK